MPAVFSTLHEELARQLEEVRARQGELTPQAIMADVTKVGRKHPLYNEFEWNNRVAGDAYRLEQAHKLIMKVKVRYVSANDEILTVRKYVATPRPMAHQPNYEPIEEIALDPLKRKIVLQEAERRWRALRAQYGHLAEFTEMILADMHDEAS